MKTFLATQGSTAWHQLRHGVVTASEADALITPLGKVKTGEGPDTYLHSKIAEKILNYSQDEMQGAGWAAEQGNIGEKIAIPFYETAYSRTVTRVGFCLTDDGRAGASPDGLVGEDGGLEIKFPQPTNAVKFLLGNRVPAQYVIQIQFSLWVTQRKWWDFLSFNMTLPPFLIRTLPDPIIQAGISEAMERFNKEFDAGEARVRSMMERQQGGRE